jgi:hypothetical protein
MQTRLLVIWFIVLFVTSVVSTITLTLVQKRLLKQFGWRVFRERPMVEIYWTNLSAKERALLWPGIILFLVTLFGGTAWKLIDSLG